MPVLTGVRWCLTLKLRKGRGVCGKDCGFRASTMLHWRLLTDSAITSESKWVFLQLRGFNCPNLMWAGDDSEAGGPIISTHWSSFCQGFLSKSPSILSSPLITHSGTLSFQFWGGVWGVWPGCWSGSIIFCSLVFVCQSVFVFVCLCVCVWTAC